MRPLEKEFYNLMRENSRICHKAHGLPYGRLPEMLSRLGGVGTAIESVLGKNYLVLHQLKMCGILETHSIEALVLKPEYVDLFQDRQEVLRIAKENIELVKHNKV